MKSLFSIFCLIAASLLILSGCGDPKKQNNLTPTESLSVSGMTCKSCSSTIESVLLKLDGVSYVKANHLSNSLKIGFDKTKISLEEIKQEIVALGFGII